MADVGTNLGRQLKDALTPKSDENTVTLGIRLDPEFESRLEEAEPLATEMNYVMGCEQCSSCSRDD
jgi:hypothetical protein